MTFRFLESGWTNDPPPAGFEEMSETKQPLNLNNVPDLPWSNNVHPNVAAPWWHLLALMKRWSTLVRSFYQKTFQNELGPGGQMLCLIDGQLSGRHSSAWRFPKEVRANSRDHTLHQTGLVQH